MLGSKWFQAHIIERKTDPTAGMEGATAPQAPAAEPAAAEEDPMKALEEAAKEAKPAN